MRTEAVDWYQQRVDACRDPALKAILAHNRDEEKEHAAMVLEWIRRNDPRSAHLRGYLFTEAASGGVRPIPGRMGRGAAPPAGPVAERRRPMSPWLPRRPAVEESGRPHERHGHGPPVLARASRHSTDLGGSTASQLAS
jgi:hypothetical protein